MEGNALKTSDYHDMVNKDIERCEQVSNNVTEAENLLSELIGKYSKASANFPDIERNVLLERRFSKIIFQYIISIKGFLEAYLLNNCEDYLPNVSNSNGVNVNIANTNTNENTNTINNTSFQDAREKIEGMSALTENQIEEILKKIDEIEEIVNSTDRKSKKWERAKDIIKWIADKGIDVGITLLPLLLKLG